VAERRDMGVVGVARRAEGQQRVRHAGDLRGHLGEVDEVEAEPAGGADRADDARPERLPVGARSIGRDEWGVVVADLGGEPGEAPRAAALLDRERKDERDVARAGTADDDSGNGSAAGANMALPAGDPVESLE